MSILKVNNLSVSSGNIKMDKLSSDVVTMYRQKVLKAFVDKYRSSLTYKMEDDNTNPAADLASISIDPYLITDDILLPTSGASGTYIMWESSHPNLISNTGVINKEIHDLNYTDSSEDWYLPSFGELILMYTVLKEENVGNFSSGMYWSSSEYDDTLAWYVTFSNGVQDKYLKGFMKYIRPVRTFISSTVYQLRDQSPTGGWIFHITNNNDGTYTYLDCSGQDFVQGTDNSFAWSNNTDSQVTGTSTDVGTGKENTRLIMLQNGHYASAAAKAKYMPVLTRNRNAILTATAIGRGSIATQEYYAAISGYVYDPGYSNNAACRNFYDKGDYSDGWRSIEYHLPQPEYTFYFRNKDYETIPYYIPIKRTSSEFGKGYDNTVLITTELFKLGKTNTTDSYDIGGLFYYMVVSDKWHLPSKEEAEVLMEYIREYYPTECTDVFYWTSTTAEDGSPYAYAYNVITNTMELKSMGIQLPVLGVRYF